MRQTYMAKPSTVEKKWYVIDELTDKIYRRHTMHPGGLKERTAGLMVEKYPEELLELSIKGMLPKNTLGRAQGMKLHVYRGAEHPHAAQKPEKYELRG